MVPGELEDIEGVPTLAAALQPEGGEPIAGAESQPIDPTQRAALRHQRVNGEQQHDQHHRLLRQAGRAGQQAGRPVSAPGPRLTVDAGARQGQAEEEGVDAAEVEPGAADVVAGGERPGGHQP